MQQMSITQAAKWASRNDCAYRVDRYTGQPDYMQAAVDQNTNLVLCIGYGDKADHYKRANPDKWIRVYTLQEVIEQIDCEEGEAGCMPGPRDAEAPCW